MVSHGPRVTLRFLTATMVLAGCCGGVLARAPEQLPPPKEQQEIRLVVLVVFDQMRGDYLQRWGDLFGKEGFRRLQSEGACFQNCHYPYASTQTAPGHASLLTGCSPDKHGIIANTWYDRTEKKNVNCVASDRYQRVPALPTRTVERRDSESDDQGVAQAPLGVSPDRLLAPTIGDVLKKTTGGKARVVALSLKDRSAVLPGGAHPDACYWFDDETGEFVTSSYYRDAPQRWVADFNERKVIDRWFDQAWTPLYPKLDYGRASAYQGAAAKPSENGGQFKIELSRLSKTPNKMYYRAVFQSPYGNDLLLELAKQAIDAEELGRRDVPDLLSISFSSNDAVGHRYGPDSPEVLDITLRSDLIVKELLAHLDARVGPGRYLLALTADHGICPLPEVAAAHGEEAKKLSPLLLRTQANDFLRQTFGKEGDKGVWVEGTSEPWIYLNRTLLSDRNLEYAEVEAALVRWLKDQSGVQTAYARSQLSAGIAANDIIGQRVARSFRLDRSGDVMVVLKPYYLIWPSLITGTNHGSPHPYDTHVPLIFLGHGISAGIHKEAVTPQAITPVFARALGIDPPLGSDAAIPESLKKK